LEIFLLGEFLKSKQAAQIGATWSQSSLDFTINWETFTMVDHKPAQVNLRTWRPTANQILGPTWALSNAWMVILWEKMFLVGYAQKIIFTVPITAYTCQILQKPKILTNTKYLTTFTMSLAMLRHVVYDDKCIFGVVIVFSINTHSTSNFNYDSNQHFIQLTNVLWTVNSIQTCTKHANHK